MLVNRWNTSSDSAK